MAKLVEYKNEPGQKIYFEIAEPKEQRTVRSGTSNLKKVSSDMIESMDDSLETALTAINSFGETVLNSIKKIAPSKAEIEFSVKLSAKGNLIIASGEAEANFSVKLTWEKVK